MFFILKTPAERSVLYRFSIFFFVLAFLTTRATVLLHEYVGHGLAMYLNNVNYKYVFLYLFGGGASAPQSGDTIHLGSALFILLSGYGIELLVGIALIFLQRKFKQSSLLALTIIFVSSILILHSLSTPASLAYYGSGDLELFSNFLGIWRPYFVVGIVLIFLMASVVLLTIYFNSFSACLSNFKMTQILTITVVAISFAIVGHITITNIEKTYVRKQFMATLEFKNSNDSGAVRSEINGQEHKAKIIQPNHFKIYTRVGFLISAFFGFYFSTRNRKRDRYNSMMKYGTTTPTIPSWSAIFKLSLVLAALLVLIFLIRTPWSMYNEVKAKKGLSVVIESPPASTKNSIETQNSNETREND